MRTQNQQPTQTVAVLTSAPSPYSCLSSPPLATIPILALLGMLGVHLVSFAVRLLRVCIMISTFSAALSTGGCNRTSLTLSLSSPFFLLVPVGVIEIILQQLYQRGNPNDKYINKLQATTRVASFRQHFLLALTRHFSFGIVKLSNKNNVVQISQSEKLLKSFAAALEKNRPF